jgi:hypothetical protein
MFFPKYLCWINSLFSLSPSVGISPQKKALFMNRGFMFQFYDLENLVNFSSKIEKLVKFTVSKQNLPNPRSVIFVEITTECFQRKRYCS